MSKICKYNLILVFIVCLLCFGCLCSAMAEGTHPDQDCANAPVYVDGLLTCRGYVIGDSTYIPLESVCGVFGFDYSCKLDTDSGVLTIKADKVRITFDIEEQYFYANGRCLYMPDGYVEMNGTPLFPIEAIAKLFTLDAKYDEDEGSWLLDSSHMATIKPAVEYYDYEDLYWMSRVITWEAGNQPLEGQIAVGNVVLNRCKSEIYPSCVKDVIFDETQFLVVESGAIYGDPWPQSVVAAKLALEGYNMIGDAMYFMTTNLPESESMEEIGVRIIGEHLFYIDKTA